MPKISIITPTYNQGNFIEQTILSVLDQGYSNVEYIIIDGGSADNTIEIINKYKKYISYTLSEKDNGQSDAINKGLKVATGEIINWLNSDDYYMPGTLQHVATMFSDPKITCYCGRSRVFSSANEYTSQGTDVYEYNQAKTIGWARIDQPETFFRKLVWDKLQKVNEDFHFVMDKELWIRYLLHFGLEGIVKDDKLLVNFRIHEKSKTGSLTAKFSQETFDLFYSIAINQNLSVGEQFTQIATVSKKDVFGYDNIDEELIGKAINYFLMHKALESYAENNYEQAKKVISQIDKNLLEHKDIKELNQVLLRMKLLPVGVKALYNKVSKRKFW